MKHEKEWYTCDRCGKELKRVPDNSSFLNYAWSKIIKSTELKLYTAERYGYISEDYLTQPEIDSLTIQCTGSYDEKVKKIHLCGKCRKEFRKFMKNKIVFEETK